MSNERFCITCRHYDSHSHYCIRESREELDVVAGKLISVNRSKSPYLERATPSIESTGFLWFTRDSGRCGSEGRFWEVKDEQ